MSLSRHAGGFDEQDIAADRRPGKPGRHAWHARAHRDLTLELRLTENCTKIVMADHDRSNSAFGDAYGGMAEYLADLSFESADAGLARVMLNDLAQRRLGDFHLPFLDTVGFHLAANQVARGNLQLLGGRIACKADDLHAVAQRPRDGVQHICGRDEHDAAEIERHAEIVVAERAVLLWI